MSYEKIKITADEGERLRKMSDRQIAVQQFVAQVQKQAEQKMIDIQQEGRQIWSELALKYDLDTKHIEYAPNNEFTDLIPVMVRLADR